MKRTARKYDCPPINLAFAVKPTFSRKVRRCFSAMLRAMDEMSRNIPFEAMTMLY